jgi:hypothetical protein
MYVRGFKLTRARVSQNVMQYMLFGMGWIYTFFVVVVVVKYIGVVEMDWILLLLVATTICIV